MKKIGLSFNFPSFIKNISYLIDVIIKNIFLGVQINKQSINILKIFENIGK